MAITKEPPNTIWLGGDRTEIGDIVASETIRPGMLVERFNSSGTQKFKKHSVTAPDVIHPALIATDQKMLNKGVDDDYAAGDLMEVSVAHKGSNWWMLIPSGATIVHGDLLTSAGTGKLQKVAGTDAGMFSALENKTAIADTRIRVEAI